MILYHGSDQIIEHPIYHGGKRTNDYGYGFYTTENIELAKEWACAGNSTGYINRYSFDEKGLKILNLNSEKYTILNWLAILTRFRTCWQNGSIAETAKKYLQENFFINPEDYDVIIGYRADDSYFSFAQDFISGAISLKKLSQAMKLGKLGEQIVLISRLSYEHISFLDSAPVDPEKYYILKTQRDHEARLQYRNTKSAEDDVNDLFIIDIVREEMKNDDPRLR